MQPFHDPGHARRHGPFWRMRSYTDLQALPAAQRAKVLPYIRAWAESAAGMTGTQVFQASQQFHTTRVATVKACSGFDYVLSPVAPCPRSPPSCPPHQRPAAPAGAHRVHGAVQHVRATCRLGQLRLHRQRSCPSGCRLPAHAFDDLGVLQVAHTPSSRSAARNALAAAAPGLKTSCAAAKKPRGLRPPGLLWGEGVFSALAQAHRVRSAHEVGQSITRPLSLAWPPSIFSELVRLSPSWRT